MLESRHEGVDTESAPSISLVLPAYNESAAILRAIEEADSALGMVTSDYEIIIVDDGSTDGTGDLVAAAGMTNPRVRLVRHSPNRGYGAAIRSGFAAAEKELIGFTDSDCQFDLTELDRFVLLSKRYDIVCGYRIDRKDSFLRCLYSRVYNQLVRCLLPVRVRDVDCALKFFHRPIAKRLNIQGNGFLVNSEMLTQASQFGCSIVEVGVSHRPRIDGSSTVSIAHIPKVLKNLMRYWWNSVQFPGLGSTSLESTSHGSASLGTERSLSGADAAYPAEPDQAGSASGASIWSGRSLRGLSAVADRFGLLHWGLLLIAAIFLLSNLGYPLIDRDETRYAEIPREMLVTGNWLVPQLNFETYYDKPPLVYWLCAISYELLGVSESSARVVPALAALGVIAATMWFGSRWFHPRIGLIAGVVLMLSAGFGFSSRYLFLDGVLTLLVTLSLAAAYEAIRDGRIRWGWWIASGVFCGLGFMTKGPLSVVLLLPPLFAFAWLTDSAAKPTWRHYGILLSIVGLVAAPWLLLVHLADPGFLVEFFYTHNVKRFAGHFHERPIWYYIPVVLIAGHPWTFLTIPFGQFLFRRNGEANRQRPPVLGYLLLSATWCFVFFSVSRCKLPSYLLPAAPAMSLMIAHYLHLVLRTPDADLRDWLPRHWSPRAATLATCCAAIGFIAFLLVTEMDNSIAIYLWAAVWLMLMAAWLVPKLLVSVAPHGPRMAWATTGGVMFLFAVMMMHQTIPAYSRATTLLGPASSLSRRFVSTSSPAIATVAHEFSEVPFYLNRSDIENFALPEDGDLGRFLEDHDRTLLIVSSQISEERLSRSFSERFAIKTVADRGFAKVIEVQPIANVPKIASEKSKNVK